MRSILLFLLLVTSLNLSAQIIEGRVLTQYREPVVGAYVIHLNSEHHTHTNELGNFQLAGVSTGDTLQVSYLGYATTKIMVGEPEEVISIALEESYFDLDQIVVQPSVKSLNFISDIDARVNPVNSAQDILRRVPGLIIGQHAGGGKAEQIFLRGFDVDHGTDVSIEVDGLPVNMVSHAHGQGYADLHFIIPETVDNIDFGKGPYYTDRGNFNTAGYVDFRLKDRLESSLLMAEIGDFNTLRTVALLDLMNNEKSSAYLASEYMLSDGPFESSQHFSRLNIMGKFVTEVGQGNQLSVLASHFDSKWDASGQIPVRAVESGRISRFGAIDDTEGGFTGRTNVAATYNRVVDRNTFVKSTVFYSRYDFELFSNFTFFLEDPENGDQIQQSEQRNLFGFSTELNKTYYAGQNEGLLQIGAGVRYDDSNDNQLSRTRNRQEILERLQFGDVDETNLFLYGNTEIELGKLLINPGLRLDHFTFNYVDNLQPTYDRLERRKTAASPKLNFIYNAKEDLQLFLKSGIGFHSNDSRVVIDETARDVLPAAYGLDLGGIVKPLPKLVVNTALWYLFLEQEFVYVGDAGIVEPSGESRRLGVDFGLRYQFTRWLYGDFDLNYAFARSVDSPENEDFIPLAPNLTSTGGLNLATSRLTANLRYRYVRDRPANEDNSIVAEGYFITDFNADYRIGPLSIGVVVENLFDEEWNETQFATESRLRNEAQPVEEIHFTPGVPRYVRARMRYRF